MSCLPSQCFCSVCVLYCIGLVLPPVAVRKELHSDCLALLQAPHIQEEAQLTLPLDINNYPFYRYVQIYFRVRCILTSVRSQRYIHLHPIRPVCNIL